MIRMNYEPFLISGIPCFIPKTLGDSPPRISRKGCVSMCVKTGEPQKERCCFPSGLPLRPKGYSPKKNSPMYSHTRAQRGCGSKPMVPLWGRCTTHFRTYFRGDWDVHWGYGSTIWILPHGHVRSVCVGGARRPGICPADGGRHRLPGCETCQSGAWSLVHVRRGKASLPLGLGGLAL